MVQRRRTSVTLCRPSSYNIVPKDTALRVISNHLEYLLDKQQLIVDKMVEFKWKGTNLDTDEREVLRSRSSVQDQIDVLKEVVDEISSAENPSSLRAVGQRLQDVHQKRALISEAEEYLCLGISLAGMPQYLVLRSKPEVVHQIDVLEKIFKEISWGQLIPLTSAHRGRQVVEYQLPPLLMRVREFRGFSDIINSEHGESPGECPGSPGEPPESPEECPGESPRECPGSPGESPRESSPESPGESPPESPGESFRRCEAVRNMKFRLSMNEIGTREAIDQVGSSELLLNKQRHTLFVTSGFEIFCLDLKECKKDQTFSNAHDVPFIPRIASLDLLEGNLPTSAGLFKWKLNAYMIGGALKEKPKDTLSCLAYSLSLADDGTLSRSGFNNIWKLKKPKLWPIVEEINGQIHVIDSAPARHDDNHGCRGCRSWQFSHEVFNPDTASWAEEIIPKLSEGARYCISNHTVLGNRIYAVADRAFLVFDPNCKEWEAHSNREWLKNRHSPKDVWHILRHGPGKCVGRFPLPSNDPLYVLIALERNYRYDLQGTHPVAHLVTSTGQILCSQQLLYFFKGPVWPSYMLDGTIIQVDDEEEEEEGKSSTFCSVVNGHAWDTSDSGYYLFINTFDVEMLTDAAAMISIRQLVAKGSEAWPGTIDQDFVRVHAKDSYVYRTDPELGWTSNSTDWSGVRACFL